MSHMQERLQRALLLEASVDRDVDPSPALQEIQEFIEVLIEQRTNEEEEEESEETSEESSFRLHFLKRTLPNAIRHLLKRKLGNVEVRGHAVSLLKKTLQLLVVCMQDDEPSLMKLLPEILDSQHKFYRRRVSGEYTNYPRSGMSYGGSPMSPNYETPLTEVDTGKFTGSPSYYHASPTLLELINCFGEMGGFDQIIERIRDEEHHIQIKYILYYLHAAELIRKLLKQSFLERWAVEVKDAVFARILNLDTEELKATSKAALIQAVEYIQTLLTDIMGTEEAGEITEVFQLKIAIQCLHCTALEKRLQGLAGVVQLIQMAQRKEQAPKVIHGFYQPQRSNQQYNAGMRGNSVLPTKWLTTTYLVQWIEEVRLIEELFGDRMHHELLKRSNEVFKLLAQKQRFDVKHLQLLWNSSVGKQEMVVTAIYDIIKDVLPHFSHDHITCLFGSLQAYPLKDYTAEFLELVKRTSDTCLTKNLSEDMKEVPLLILWNAIQDDAASTEEIFHLSLEYLKSSFLTLRSSVRELKTPFINRCVENLANFTSAPQSLDVLMAILDLFPSNQMLRMSNSECLDQVIESLQSSSDLVGKFVADLRHYKVLAFRDSKPEDNNSSHPLGGYYNHTQHIESRLEFFKFIQQHSPQAVTKEHLNAIWDCVILNPLSPTELNIGFQTFYTLCDKFWLTGESAEFLFLEKLGKYHFADMTKAGFQCFERYFRYINGQQEKIDRSPYSGHFIVTDFDLTGLDVLWEIALNVRDPAVVSDVISYLGTLNDRLSVHLRSQANKNREKYILKVMEKLEQASTLRLSVGLEQAEFRIERCLNLLQKFVDDYQAKVRVQRRGHGVPVRISLRYTDGYRSDFKVSLTPFTYDTLADVRDTLIRKFKSMMDVDTQSLYIFMRGKEIAEKDYLKTLKELGIDESTQLSIKIGEKKEQVRSVASSKMSLPSETDLNSPQYLLSNNSACFNQLFDLLDFNSAVGGKVWDLISQLPINPVMHKAMQSVDESTHWDQLLCVDSTYKLLYMLQIIETITTESHESRGEQDEQALWYSTFASTGGFKHIYSIFLDHQNSLQGDLRKVCLESLLKLINIFMLVKSSEHGYVLKDVELWDWIDYPTLVTHLLYIIWASAKDTNESECDIDGKLVQHAGSLLMASLFSKPELLQTLYSFPQLDEFVRSVLLETAEDQIRQVMSTGITQLCLASSEQSGFKVFLPLLINLLSVLSPNSQFCNEYFTVLSTLVKNVLARHGAQEPPVEVNSYELADTLVSLIKSHPMVETCESGEKDLVIMGLMNLLSILLSVTDSEDLKLHVGSSSGSQLIGHLFYHCLFEIPTAERHGRNAPPFCKTKDSRKAAFDLLSVLTHNCNQSYMEQLALVERCHLSAAVACNNTEWNYSPMAEQLSSVGYVGIRNLGCICYMNSLLQQLFMMPMFRRSILALEDPGEDEENPKCENLVYQMQTMYSYLQESQKQYYDPVDFCRASKDYDGQPTDVTVQMDVDEFFNMLCDRLEQHLKGTEQEKLLEHTWGGKLCGQSICQECKYVSERDEMCSAVQLDVKNKSTVVEALESYVQGEMLEGDNAYFCEKCDRKVSALKRSCIGALPSTLILILKRFEFNFDTMRKVKLNDYVEFPQSLNMEPYTKEGLAKKEEEEARKEGKDLPGTNVEMHPPEYYQYRLAGVLVHRGVADSGHYYSFIKKRVPASAGELEQWIEFNDEIVRPFDINNLERECFGGKEEIPVRDGVGGNFQKVITRTNNAYMLFYERESETIPQEIEPSGDILCSSMDLRRSKSMAVSRKPEETFSVAMPVELYEEVWKENVGFLQDKKVFDRDYFEYILSLLEYYRPEPNLEYVSLPTTEFSPLATAIRFLVEVLVHSKEKEIVAKVVQKLSLKLQQNLPATIWFLELMAHGNWLRHLLLECGSKDVREQIAQLIVHGIKILSPYEGESFHATVTDGCDVDPQDYLVEEEEEEEEEMESLPTLPSIAQDGPVSLRLMEKIFSLFRILPFFWKNFGQFFLVFRDFAKIGSTQRVYLFSKKFTVLVYNLMILGTAFPRLKKVPKMGDKFEKPNFANACGALAVLLCGTPILRDTEDIEDETETISEFSCPFAVCQPEEFVDFPQSQLRLILSEDNVFIKKAVHDKGNALPLAKLFRYWSWNSIEHTEKTCDLLRQGVHSSEWSDMQPWFKVIGPYINQTKDRYKELRVARIMEGLMNTLQKFKQYPKFTKNLITFIFELYEEISNVKDWMNRNKNRWNWCESWMLQHGATIRALQSQKWTSINYYNSRPQSGHSMGMRQYPI